MTPGRYVSELNSGGAIAGEGEFGALQLGGLSVYPPVVLAPMAGVTNAPFRRLCRKFSGDRCLYVSEMITARAFVEGHGRTLKLASFGKDEGVRSIQLYGTQAESLEVATRTLVEEWGVHHIDLNFGCPVRKVTAAGGGAAIPARPGLMARLVRAVVGMAGKVPVTVKFRKGIDDQLSTFLQAGRVAEAEGCVAVALHGRTAAQLYHGDADWDAIGELKSAMEIPVLGNGDVFEARDALRMMRQTGGDGGVGGRGCLGRPWLFGELVEVFAGREPPAPPDLGGVVDVALEHARLLVEFFGEAVGMQQMRKFAGWYTRSFPATRRLQGEMHQVVKLTELQELLGRLPRSVPFPLAGLRVRRGKTGRVQKVSLPPGFLDDRYDDRSLADPSVADAALSGG